MTSATAPTARTTTSGRAATMRAVVKAKAGPGVEIREVIKAVLEAVEVPR